MNEKYLEAVKTIKTAILRSQNRAAKYTNAEMLSLYFSIGGYVSGNSREGTWGTGAIDEISTRLREELPGLRGFSSGNIKLMRQFFEAWYPYLQTNTVLSSENKSIATAIDFEQTDDPGLVISRKRLPAATDFPGEAFMEISFTHHMEILHKTKELDERLFYIRECAAGHWSKTALRTRLKENLYQHKGALTNNFSMTLSDDKQYMKAIRTFKDEYFLDFINTEELDLTDPQDLDERVLEKEIIRNIKKGENPAIGILLCHEANKSVVELAIRDYSKPMGVATYRTADELPAGYKVLAPIIEEVPKMLNEAEYVEGGEYE